MESETGLAKWLPDRAPTWTDVAMGGLGVAMFASNVVTMSGLKWGWVTAAFVATALAAGPVAKSSVGASVGDWFRAIGVLGRVVVILLFAVAVWVGRAALELSETLLGSVASGVFLAVASLVAIAVARSRTVEGW